MIYKEKLWLRERIFTIDDFGVSVYDKGFFKTFKRHYKFDQIGESVNFISSDLLKNIIYSILWIGLSIYFFQSQIKYSLILTLASIMILIIYLVSIIKNSTYLGTIFFSNNKKPRGHDIYLKSQYPFPEETNSFLKLLRQKTIDYSYNSFIERNKVHKLYKENYRNNLLSLKEKYKLTEKEYKALCEKLNDFLDLNNISNNPYYDERHNV